MFQDDESMTISSGFGIGRIKEMEKTVKSQGDVSWNEPTGEERARCGNLFVGRPLSFLDFKEALKEYEPEGNTDYPSQIIYSPNADKVIDFVEKKTNISSNTTYEEVKLREIQKKLLSDSTIDSVLAISLINFEFNTVGVNTDKDKKMVIKKYLPAFCANVRKYKKSGRDMPDPIRNLLTYFSEPNRM